MEAGVGAFNFSLLQNSGSSFCFLTLSKMSTIFSRIIAGEIPAYKIYENELVYAFLDIHPLCPGHTLLVPKIEVDYFAQVPADYASALMLASQKIAQALDKATGCPRTQLMIAGRDVPHCHMHLVPSESIADIRKAETLSLSDEQMKAIQGQILHFLENE